MKNTTHLKCSCSSLEPIKKTKYVLKNKKVTRIDLISKELWNGRCKLGLNIPTKIQEGYGTLRQLPTKKDVTHCKSWIRMLFKFQMRLAAIKISAVTVRLLHLQRTNMILIMVIMYDLMPTLIDRQINVLAWLSSTVTTRESMLMVL